jgi:glutaredoxin 3
MPTHIRMYSTHICPYCIRAENLLKQRGVSTIEKIFVDNNPERMQEMTRITGRRTVPQIFIGERHVGGYDDLVELDIEGGLIPLLQPQTSSVETN